MKNTKLTEVLQTHQGLKSLSCRVEELQSDEELYEWAKEIRKKNSSWWGVPAIPYMEYLRAYIKFKDLPNIEKRLSLLEKKLEEATNGEELDT